MHSNSEQPHVSFSYAYAQLTQYRAALLDGCSGLADAMFNACASTFRRLRNSGMTLEFRV